MADAEDKEKAEKLAAAKKRFEQLKKQQKGKKGGKKKDDATEPTEPAEQSSTPADDEAVPATSPPATAESGHGRKPSESLQSMQRSESFRKASSGSPSGGLKSPPLPTISPEGEVQEIYRKQHSRIEELEKENKSLNEARSELEAKLQKTDEELEQLREASGEVAELRSKVASADEKANEVEKLNAEVTSLQRQLTQAQAAVEKSRHRSNTSPSHELTEQLAQKTSTIESLELELSNLKNQYHISQSTNDANKSTIADLETRLKSAGAATEIANQEIQTLKDSLAKPAEEAKDKPEDEDPALLQQRIALLESDLRTAQTSATEAVTRATSLEQKAEALTKLHKDATTTATTREKELAALKSRLDDSERTKSSKPGDAEESPSDLEEEEREKLHARVRELEAENFNLRRGVWREKRQALQPTIEDDPSGATSPAYEDIDLNGPNPYGGGSAAGASNQRGSTFQDVLQSGISAFTGRDRRERVDPSASDKTRGRGMSLGLLSEDGFDEDAFRLAQEEEGKRRIERVKEVKRGLENWRGWRVDLVDMRQGGLGGNSNTWTGPVFDV